MPQKHPVLCEVDRRYSMSKIGVQYISTNRSKKPQPKNQQCRVSPNCRCSICLGWFNYRVFSLAGVVSWEWAVIQSTASSSQVNFPKWCTAPFGHTIFTRQISPSRTGNKTVHYVAINQSMLPWMRLTSPFG